jgi:hypothetical protein
MVRFIGRLTGRQGWPWVLLLLFAPVGYFAGSRAITAYDRHAKLGIAVSRDEAIAIASRFVTAKGLAADKASILATLDIDNDLRRYATFHPATANFVRPFAQPARIRVSLFFPKNVASVLVAPDGRIVSWDLGTPDHRPAASVTNTSPGRDAEMALQQELGVAEAGKFQFEGSSKSKEGREVFTWRRKFAELPGLSIHAEVTAGNHEITAFTSKVEVEHPLVTTPVLARAAVVTALFLVLAGYVLFRFVRRLREQEVPVGRSIVIAVAVAVLWFSATQLTDVARINVPDRSAWVMMMIIIAAVMLFIGLAAGLTWGACEGDVREEYPSKLASFDALLGGRAYSRIVARSAVLGVGFGALCILVSGLNAFVLRNGWRSLEAAPILTARAPAVAAFVYALVGSPLVAGFGLLVPISLLHGRIRSRMRLGLVAGLLICVMFSLLSMENSDPMLPGIVATIISTAVAILPFFAVDLLTGFVANAMAGIVAFSIYMLSQPSAALHTSGREVIAALIVLSAGAVFTALWGPEVSGAALAPQYAGNIAERLSLQAEWAASRQAQLRILPRQLPQSELVSIAAECRSIDAEGSDYYDIIELGGGRLGVLLASCTAPGLSAALSVTMLKGLLTSYARRWRSPFEVLTRVRARLVGVFGSDLQMSVFYSVLDAGTRRMELARLGDAPLLITLGSAQSGRVVEPELQRADGEGSLRIEEGRATFAPFQSIVISNAPSQLIRPQELTGMEGESTSSILSALFHHTKQGRSSEDGPNDFSAIVISLTSPVAAMP